MTTRTTRSVTSLVVAFAAVSGVAAGSPPAPAAMSQESASAVVARVAAEVATIRGLPFERDVSVRVIDDAEARRHLLRRLELFDYQDELDVIGRVYARLGALEPETDLLDRFLHFFEEQAGGFYDPQSKSYFLLDDIPPAMVETYTAHELTHALEDQHYDLDGRLRASMANDDLVFALGALHEGSATVVMTVYMTRAALRGELSLEAMQAVAEAEAERAGRVASLPDVLLRQAIGPYVLGVHFVTRGNAMAAATGYPAEDVRRAFEDGPTSSEQILHPEKYWDDALRDEPRAVELRDAGRALGRGWSLVADGVLGELGIGSLVGASMPGALSSPEALSAGSWTNDAAAGWGGDRWELWSREGEDVVLLSTVWDSARDAEEFAAALAEHSSRLVGERDGARVAVVAGEVGRRTQRVLRRMLAAARSTPVVEPAPTR